MTRTLWADPTPIIPTDTSGIQAKLDQIIADELVDDATAAALKTVVDAIKIPDISGKADKTAVDAAIAVIDAKNVAQDVAIAKNTPSDVVTPIYEPIPAPAPLVIYKSSYVAKDNTGTLLVNQGATHTALRTTGAKIVPNSEQVFVVPAAYISTASVKIRFAILTAKVGTLLIELDSAPALTASGDSTAWVSASPSMVVRTDGLWSWFEIVIPSGQNDIYVRFCVPPGVIGAPCLYDAAASASLFSSVVLGMRLKTDGKTMDYRPSELLKKSEAKEIVTVPVIWAQNIDFAVAMPKDGIYLFVCTTIDTATGSSWRLINPPAGATFSMDGITRSFNGTPVGYSFFSIEIVLCVREGLKYTFTTMGLDNYENVRHSTRSTVTQALFGTAEKLQGFLPARWMGLTEGSIQWIQSDAGVTFQTLLNSWNSNAGSEFAISDITFDGISATLTAEISLGSYVISWRQGVLRMQSISTAPKSSSWAIANAGVAVAVGSRLRVQVPTSGNRSLQLSTASGSIVVSGLTYYNASGAPASISTTLTTTWVHAVSTWNFGTAGSVQTIMLLDANGQKWKITMVIGDSYNNNVFTVEEI
jgi:hypothetical protein